MASCSIYQLNAEVKGYKPRMWRRFQVSEDITLARLAYIIMTLFEMRANHLFDFEIRINLNKSKLIKELGRKNIEISRKSLLKIIKIGLPDSQTNELDESIYDFNIFEVKMKQLITSDMPKIRFRYDFGDNWEINVKLEKIIIDEVLSKKGLPRVLKGKGYGIIEDCGGVDGLKSIAEAYSEKSGEEYENYCEWLLDDDIDLVSFDIEDMNNRLKKIPRIYEKLYEDGIYPTEKEIELIERNY